MTVDAGPPPFDADEYRSRLEAVRAQATTAELRVMLAPTRDRIVDEAASTDRTVRQRLLASMRLPARILDALVSLHRTLAAMDQRRRSRVSSGRQTRPAAR